MVDSGSPRVLAVGLATLDILGTVPSYPEKNTKSVLSSTSFAGGGPAATAAAAAAQLGAPASFVGKVGDDTFGRLILSGLTDAGVDVSRTVVSAGERSSFSFVAVDEGDASRTIFHSPGSALEAGEVDWTCLDGAGALIVDTRQPSAQIEAARRARALGIQVIVDAETMRPGTRELLASGPLLIASQRFAQEVAPSASPGDQLRALLALGPGQVVVTLGEAGSIALRGDTVVHQPAFPVTAVDTTGCGDVYHGAFAVALIDGCSLEQAMAFSAAAAALKARAIGGRAALPTRAQVLELLGR